MQFEAHTHTHVYEYIVNVIERFIVYVHICMCVCVWTHIFCVRLSALLAFKPLTTLFNQCLHTRVYTHSHSHAHSHVDILVAIVGCKEVCFGQIGGAPGM